MGKTFEKRGREPKVDRDLTSRPMAGAFKGIKVGPECLECRGPIDSRTGWSVQNPKGSRKNQRNGYLHPDCEEKAALRMAEAQGKVVTRRDGTKAAGRGVVMEVPVLDEEEIAQAIQGKENEA